MSKNGSYNYYILNTGSDIFNLKDYYFKKEDLPFDRYYIFGKTKDFGKTYKKIEKFFDNQDLPIEYHASFYRIISFLKRELVYPFEDYIEKELKIKIYNDDVYQEKNNYSLQHLLIGDFDDYLSSRILQYRTEDFYQPPYDCINHHLHNIKLTNDHKVDPYRKFPKEGIGASEVADNIIHSRRVLKNCTYLYIVGPENVSEGLHNFKVGIAKDLNARIIFYQSHSPNKVKLHFFQSCYDFGYHQNAKFYERMIHKIIKRGLTMIHQDWCRTSLNNILDLVKNHLKLLNQPEYKVVRYTRISDIYIPIKTYELENGKQSEVLDDASCDHIFIDEYEFILGKIPGGRYGYKTERDRRKKIIKKFKDLDSLYKYFYKNFDKITNPQKKPNKK